MTRKVDRHDDDRHEIDRHGNKDAESGRPVQLDPKDKKSDQIRPPHPAPEKAPGQPPVK